MIGTMTPDAPLTADRIAVLTAKEQPAWRDYLARSEARARIDRDTLLRERQGLTDIPPPPKEGDGVASMPLDRDAAWYATEAARHIGDVILSFQTPAGGWGKNAPRDGAPRRKGQSFVVEDETHYVGTIDNDATVTELRFLARLSDAAPEGDGNAYRIGLQDGLTYLYNAQYPNGGWPQVWPLEGGYHDAVTFNDDAIANVMGLLSDVIAGKEGFGFVPQPMRDRAATAYRKAVAMILACQVRSEGRLTAWGQQHDPLTLAPAGARNFEPASLSSGESAGLLRVLMRIGAPSPEVIAAVHAGAAWLNATALHGVAWIKGANGKVLVPDPGAKPLWARYYSLSDGRPVFGDRDRTIHDAVTDLSDERRNGYAWYVTTPQKALDAYAKWSLSHPL